MADPANLAKKALIPAALITLLAAGSYVFLRTQVRGPHLQGQGHVEVTVGSVLPDFELQEFGGAKVRFSDLKARVALVNFWASWCESCMVEMPSIVELRSSFKDKGFAVLAVNVDEHPDALLPKLLRQLKIDFKVYTDREGQLAELFDVHAIPLTVILDGNRKVLFIESGEKNWNATDFRSQMESWLAG